jgi:DedD protein
MPKSTAADKPAALERPAPSPTSASLVKKPSAHAWAVQLGVFASRANADKLAHELKGQGFGVYVLSGGSGAGARYRVRVGPITDRAAAAQTLAKLQAMGHSASLAPPGS